MANTTIPNLPVAITLDGTEELEIVQPPGSASGVSKRATAQQIANLAPSNITLPINLASTAQVTGILPVPNGGTGASTLISNGILLGNGTSALSAVSPGTSGYVLTANGTSSAPTFQAAGGLSNQPGLSVLGVTGNATASPAGITGTTDQVLRVDPTGTGLTFGQVNLGASAAVTSRLGFSNLQTTAGLSVLGVAGAASATLAGIAGTTNQVLVVNPGGTGVAFGQVNLSAAAAVTGSLASSSISGIIAVPFGGTGTGTLTAFGVVVGNGTSSVGVTSAGSAGQLLIGQTTTSQPSFQTASGDVTVAASGAHTIAANAVTYAKFQTVAALSVVGNTSSAVVNAAAITGTANQVLVVNPAGTALTFGQVSLSTASGVSGVLPVGNGGSGASTLAAHGVLIGNGTTAVTVSAVGSNGQLLIGQTGADPAWTTESGDVTLSSAGTATIANNAVTFAKFQTMAALSVHGNSSSATTNSVAIAGTANQVLVVNAAGTGLAFGQVNIATGTGVTGVLPVGNGGSGQSTLTAHGVLIGNGTSAVTLSAVGSNGQLLIGQTGADPTWNTMSGDVTLASVGTATIANNAVTYAKFQTVTGLSVVGNGSTATTNAGAITGTTNQVLVVNPGGTGVAFSQLNLSAAAAVTGVLSTAFMSMSGIMLLATTAQLFTGGVSLTALSLGTAAGSTTTLTAGNPPIQILVLNGTSAIVAPSGDCEIDLLLKNSTSASTLTFSGYTGLSSVGDAYTTTNGSAYIFMSRTINAISTYALKVAK